MKKFLSLLLLALLSVTQAMAYDFEVDGIYYTKSGTNATVTFKDFNYNSYSGDVVIPETVMYKDVTYSVTRIGGGAFRDCSNLTSIIIPETVTTIEGSAFDNCTSITSLIIPNSVESIGGNIFHNCCNLESLTVPFIGASADDPRVLGYFFSNNNTSSGMTYVIQTMENGKFYTHLSPNLKEVKVNGGVLGYGAFSNCTMLENVIIGENVTRIEQKVFDGCGINKIITSSIESWCNIEGLDNLWNSLGQVDFYLNNEVVNNLVIPESVTSISTGAFKNSKIESAIIPNSVTNIGDYAFQKSTNLNRVNIGNGINSIGVGAFPANNSIQIVIEAIEVPALSDATSFGANTLLFVPKESIDSYKQAEYWNSHAGFITCIGNPTYYDVDVTANATASILHMTIGEENLVSVVDLKVSGTINGYDLMIMREKMINLRHLDLSDATLVYNEYKYNTAGYVSRDNTLTEHCLNESLESLILPKNLSTIANYACADCKYIKEIVIPLNVASIGDYAFSGCSSLENIVWNESLTSLGSSAFNECKSLQYIVLPTSLTYKGKDVLKGCDHLVEVTIPFMGSTIDKSEKFNYTISASASSANYTGSGGFDFPKTLKKFTVLAGDIKDYAFGAMVNIGQSANFQFDLIFGDGVTRFGKGVFMYNDSYTNGYIRSVTLGKNVKYFDDKAFYGLSAINEFNFDNVEHIGQYAFAKTGLEKVVIPTNLETFGNYAFANNKNLKSVTLPVNSQLHIIPVGAFKDCPAIERVDFPVSVTRIGEDAFRNCTALAEVRIPTGMTNVGNYAFDGCPNLNNVYTYTVEPQDIQQDTFSSYQTATLYCPKVSYYNYYYATPWNRFLKLEPFDEPYQYVYIEKDFNIFSDVISGSPEFRIGTGGGLIMNSVVKQVADILHIKFDPSIGKGSSIISNGMIDAYTLKVDIDVKKDFWHFFCFPFDVDLTTGVEKDGSWIFREFDGMSRAENGTGNSWKDITGTKLEAGKGYIFRTNTAGTLTLTVAGLAGGKIDLRCSNIVKQLQDCFKGGSSAATEPADKNWNFIGNGYFSYYDINDLDYSAPIMTWDGSKYVAYRPGDDDCVLTPFQGFFVQKPENNDVGVGFKADARTTYLKSQDPAARSASRRKAAARLTSSRKLVNLTVINATDEEATADKARVVFNEKQTMDYELECDASKFISTENVPLIYSLDARGTRYAINERPMGDGRVSLGFIAREDGTYTIAATRMDVPVVLIDNATGTTHDLNDGDYTFTADKGIYEQRFVLAVAEDYLADGINAVNADEQGAAANIYDLQGKRVERQQGVTIQNGKKVVSAM